MNNRIIDIVEHKWSPYYQQISLCGKKEKRKKYNFKNNLKLTIVSIIIIVLR